MNSIETLEAYHFYFKKKVCILGGQETYKDEFQKILSSNYLSIENKQNIGVNISKIDFLYKPKQKFEFLLWNIDCGQQRAFLRTIFYSGADAIIIFISENKINQIRQYFEEVIARIPEVILIFCIILEKHTKKEIIDIYFNHEEIRSIINEYNFQINEINEANEIFNEVSSFVKRKIKNKNLESSFIINFISLSSLFGNRSIRDECNDYFEPVTHRLRVNQTINTELLSSYIEKLDLEIEFDYLNWIKLKNKNFGLFSIYLKNGNVYYFPQICEKCKNKNCSKFKKAPYYICIEAGDSKGWSNLKGFNQNMLLILAKILALKEGNEGNLPKSVVKQIKNINICDYHKKKK
ncbi:MAG: hypothetical protein ACFFA0_11665 [Promethearchaeota archaeon]